MNNFFIFLLRFFYRGNVMVTVRNFLLFTLLLFVQFSFAQKKSITGTVVDESKFPLPGVSVSIKNTTVGVETDFDGKFTINVPETGNVILIFNYLGYKVREIDAKDKIILNVSLEPDITSLQEIVVVGYGTQKKESLTAAVSVISNEEIQTTTNVSVAQKLAGKVAGVQIRQQSGQPGAFDNNINIRGFGNPIYVIDGIRRGGSRDFQQLNADDIETISVLKDGAASIYGLDAQNGVILVTTKKGKKGAKPTFNYNTVFSVVEPTDLPRMASAAEYVQMWNDTQLFIPGGSGTPFFSRDEVNNWIAGGPGYESTDWGQLVLKESSSTLQHNFSAKGGSEKTNYYIGFGFVQDEGLLRSNDIGYKRYNFRVNLTTELAKNLTASVLLSGRRDKRTQPGSSFFNIFKGTRVALPIESAYANNNPDFLRTISGTVLNPLALMERDITGYNDRHTRQLTTQFSAEYKVPFVEGLSLKGMIAYDGENYQGKAVSPPFNLFTYDEVNDDYLAQTQRDGNASIVNENSNRDETTFQFYVNYNRTFNENHEVSATGVIERYSFFNRFSNVRRLYADFFTKDQIRFADQIGQTSDGLEEQRANFSYIGRLNYAYKGKYLFEVSGRYNGDYRYGDGNKYGLFGYGSVGWRISEEKFIKDNVDWISNLKLRASLGFVGEPGGGAFQTVPGYVIGSGGSYEFVDGVLTEGIRTPPATNTNLTWLENTTTNIGLDIGLFNNRLNFTTEVYQRLRSGIPVRPSISLPNTFGGLLPEENLNSETTQGYELVLSYRDRIGEDFSYDISANFNHARTKRNHVEGNGPFTNSMSRWRNQRTDRWNDIQWGYNYIGQFQSEEALRNAPLQNGDRSNIEEGGLPGDFQYEDWNGDGVVDGQDVQPLFFGGNPKMFYGLTLNMSYKGFYMNMVLQGAANYTVRFREVYGEIFAFRGNAPAYFFDRWRKADPFDVSSEWIPGKWPASRTVADAGSLYRESSVWRRDASYLRMKSLEFGYNLKVKGMEDAIGITNLRLYASGFNLFTWADEFVKPFDPEKVEGAFSAGLNYPVTRTFNFGVNIDF